MEDILHGNNNIEEMNYRLLKITQNCTIEEISIIFKDMKNILHLATTVTHNCQM